MLRATRVVLRREALLNNLRLLKKWNGDDFFCPMIKANAYGHGDLAVAHELAQVGVSAVGVSMVEEALHLRSGGVTLPILVLAPFDKAAASAMLTHQLTPVVTRFEDLEALTSLQWKSPIRVHLKFNTGMCRLGFDSSENRALRDWLARHPEIQVDGVCTHLSHGDEVTETHGRTAQQLRLFHELTAGLPGVRHAHKSSSLATYAEQGLVKPPGVGARPGISLYGLVHEAQKLGPGLLPVLEWHSSIVRLHQIAKGESVSYGSRWTASRPSLIGVLPVGYGDGYMRVLSNRASMLVRGLRVPIVGSVCMDYTMVDLTAVQDRFGDVRLGEEIVLIGRQGQEQITAGELAELAGTIAYEVVTAIRSRVPREVE